MTGRHFVLAAFTRGLFDAAPRASVFRWIVDDGGTPCPDAEDNALQGQVSEWSNEHAWKACVAAMLPRVRIPPCPPFLPHSK